VAADVASVVAAFAGPDRAKAAMASLERAGIAHRDVSLLNDVSGPRAASIPRGDDRVVGWFTRRWLRGAAVGAIVGAAGFVAFLAAVCDGSLYPIWIGAALGGAAAGAFVGGFVWVGIGLPRNPRAWDTYLLEHNNETCVAVRIRRPDAVHDVSEVLQRAGATSIEVLQ
jgi:hypothetical protein